MFERELAVADTFVASIVNVALEVEQREALPRPYEEGIREVILEGVRLEVGRQTVDSGADAVMVRELVYRSDPAVAASDFPEIVAAEGILLHFVDPGCLPAQ